MRRLVPFLAVTLLFATAFFGSMIAARVQAGTTGFDDILALNATVAKDLNVAGASNFVGATSMRVPVMASVSITPTAGQTITPAYGAYYINSTGSVSITLAACSTQGQTVTLYGDDNNTITVNDTNIRTADGNALTLGQYDLALLQCFDTEWHAISKAALQ